jgi:CheY-like chemotaxis protein
VLLNYDLPDMNAMEALTELRAGSELPPRPVDDIASAKAAAEGEPFDVLVCDLSLPDGDAYEFMRCIR